MRCLIILALLLTPLSAEAQYPYYGGYNPYMHGYRTFYIPPSGPSYYNLYQGHPLPQMQYRLTPYRERVARNRMYMTFGPGASK
jgi:hypothetical protein